MKHSKCSRLLALLLALVMVIGMMPTVAFAEGAEDVVVAAEGKDNQTTGGDTTSSGEGTTEDVTTGEQVQSLAQKVYAASDNQTITLTAGTYEIPAGVESGKTVPTGLTISGAGAESTIVNVQGTTSGESTATYFFDGGKAVTFKDLTINFGETSNFDGFARAGDMTFEHVTIKGMGSLWGTGAVKFMNCSFVYPDEGYNEWTYNLWTYSGSSFTFENCAFAAKLGGGNEQNPAKGKFVNVYNQLPAETVGVSTVGVSMDTCKFKTEKADGTSVTANKPILNVGTGSAWNISMNNIDITEAEAAVDETTGSNLYGGNGISNSETETSVMINGTTAWTNGGKATANVAEVGGTGYPTLAEAIAAAKDSDTVTLLTATTKLIQELLDGQHGSIDGLTIELPTGDYGQLELGRATKYAGSNTEYFVGSFDSTATNYKAFANADEIREYKGQSAWTPSCYYHRALNNVTIKAADGAMVTIEKISADAGQIYGKAGALKYDYVLDVEIPDTNKSYYMALAWNNVTFEGINFKSSVNIESSSEKTLIDGLHFEKCNFNSGYTALHAANDANATSKGMGIRFVSWTKTTNNLHNLTVNNCTFEDCSEGVYTNPVYGVSVTNSSFKNINHNAVAIQDVDSAVNHGNVVISGNTFTNVSDRIIRFNNAGKDTTITITGNTSVNSGDSDGEIIKATTMPDSVNINMTSNTWGDVNGKTAVLGNGFKPTASAAVATVGGAEYATLAEAIAKAKDGETVKLLKDCEGDGILIAKDTFKTGLTIDFDGHTYTMTGSPVGSSGSENQAAHFESGNTIILTNGAISVNTTAQVKFVIQNYADLTLEKMTLNDTGLTQTIIDGYPYVLSSNNGKVVIDQTTITTTGKWSYAIDVCGFSSYPGTDVTIKGNSAINGEVKVSSVSADGTGYDLALKLESGSVKKLSVLTSGGKAKITKEDGFTVTTIPDGYEWVTDDDGNTTLQPGDYQAFIKYGTKWTYFKTLQDAVNEAADDGKTVIWLNKDIDNFEGIEITRSLIINFNSHTITGASGVSVLKITGATVKLTADSKGVGGINGGSNGDNRAIWVGKDADVTIERGTYTVGGDASGLGNSTILVTDNGKVTIKGGTFSSEKPHDGKYYVLDLQNGCAGTITVKGGKFLNFDPIKGDDHDGGNFCGTNTGITKNSEGYYVAQASMSIQIVDADGGSVKAYTAKKAATAFADVQDGQTIKLLQDTSVSAALTIDADKKVTLDLNGKKLSTSYRADDPTKHYYAIDNYGTFTLKDSSTEQSGEIRARGIENLEGGTMVIESGKIVAVDDGGAAIWNEAKNGAMPVLTIQGGTFVAEYEGASGDQYGPGCVYSKGTLTISGGTFESANKRTYAVISESGTVTITPAEGKNVTISGAHGGVGINGGTATINGGSYDSTDCYGLYVSSDVETATVTVNGGTFDGNKYSVLIGSDGQNKVTSTLTIKNGTFNKPIHAQENTGTGAIQVSGGTFRSPVDPAYCANGFIPTSTTKDGVTTYGVAQGSYVASVTTADGTVTEYATLQAAFDAASNGDTVKLLKDFTTDATKTAASDRLTVNKDVTLDLNGYTMTIPGELEDSSNWAAFYITGGTMTVKDSSEEQKGAIIGANKTIENPKYKGGVYLFDVNNGAALVIENGTYYAGGTVVQVTKGTATIKGGTFSVYPDIGTNDSRYILNCIDAAYTNGTAKIIVNGGTFTGYDPRNNAAEGPNTSVVAEGVGVDANSDGTFTAKSGMVAQIIGVDGSSKKACKTLQEAIDAAKRNDTVKLLANTRENVTISTSDVTLDLNGYTLNGSTGERKPALTVTAKNTVVKDSSEAKTGTIKREDTAENSGITSHYVIDVQGAGWLTFESGNVTNDSGNKNGEGASLVRVGDDSVASYPGLNIKGGTFTQDNFIVIKVDRGDLFLNGGTLTSANDYAVQNWHRATIKGGTVNGAVSSWTYSGGLNSDLTISGGTVNGDVYSVTYDGTEGKLAKVAITGGKVTGDLVTRKYDKTTGELTTIEDAAKATIEVTGGTFSNDPAKYVVENSAVTKNADGTFGVEKAYLASVGGTSYYTMDEAFKAQTASGEAIVLLRDYTTGSTFNSGTIPRVVDLNGNTWTCTGTDANSAAFEINNPNASLTVKNGKIVSSQLVGLIPSAMGGTIKYDNSRLTFDGVVMSTTATSGIETNGNNKDDNVTLKNSTLNVPNGFGIYFPSSGKLTIESSTINAKTMGVQLCAGSLSIDAGSAIAVSGDAVPKAEGDGAIQDGAAISIVNRKGYKGLGTITVTGGTFTAKGTNAAAIKAYDWNNTNKTEEAFTESTKVSVSGGTFSSPVDETLCKDGFIPTSSTTADGKTTYGVKVGSYVASVTTADGVETKYETLQAAINAAEANATVTLLADTTADVTISKNITLDLGSKTLTNDNSNASQSTLTIVAGATATVKNGSIIGGTGHYNIAVGTKTQPGGELTLENVTATAGNTGSSMIDNWGTLTINSGTYTGGLNVVKSEEGSNLTITGGKFELNYAQGWDYNGVILSAGTTKITGGEFIQNATTPVRANPQVILAMVVEGYTSKIEITGGTFTNNKSGKDNIFHGYGKANSSNFEVKGGTFNKSISEGYCADGFIPVETTVDGKTVYGVKVGQYVAAIGSNNYETLEAAIAKANKNSRPVKLLADTELTADLVVGKTITLDLNGKTIETAGHKFDITGNLTITGNGTINNAKAATARNDLHIMLYVETNGKLTIENGTFTTMAAQIVYTKGSATIKNGTFENVNTNDDDATTEALNAKSLIAVNGTSASLTMTGGKVATKCEYLYGVFIQEGGKAVFGDAETKEGPSITTNRYAAIGENNTMATADITIYGGDYTVSTTPASDAWAPYCAVIYASASGSINIHDGTFTGYYIISDRYQKVEQTVTITGGTFNGTAADLYVTSEGGSGTTANRTIAISGGKFTHKVDEKYCALGYQPTEQLEGGKYSVKEVDKEAAYVDANDKTAYDTLANALTKAKSGTTITLLKNSEANGDFLYISSDKTLDLNGKNLSVSGMLLAFGHVVDSTDGSGLLKVTNTTGSQMPSDNPSLPIYDKQTNGYRLYNYTCVGSQGNSGLTESGTVSFAFSLTMSDAAWGALKNDDESVKFRYEATWGNAKLLLSFSDETFNTAEAKNGTTYGIMKVGGLDALKGAALTMKPVISCAFFENMTMASSMYTPAN